jgi:hypothetical protein
MVVHTPSTLSSTRTQARLRSERAFTLLLEGVMTLSHVPVLPVICLCWLAGINLLVANVKSGKRKYKLAK